MHSPVTFAGNCIKAREGFAELGVSREAEISFSGIVAACSNLSCRLVSRNSASEDGKLAQCAAASRQAPVRRITLLYIPPVPTDSRTFTTSSGGARIFSGQMRMTKHVWKQSCAG